MSAGDGFVITATLLLAPLAKMVEFAAAPAIGGPDILTVLAVCLGWSCDIWNALPAGFALGVIEDVVTARALGSRAVSLALAAALACGMKRVMNPDSLSSKALAALGGSTLADFATWGILWSMEIRIAATHFLRAILGPSALWSLALIGPLDFGVRWLARVVQAVWPASGRKSKETAL
jgi:rod shape-determining protein MreD